MAGKSFEDEIAYAFFTMVGLALVLLIIFSLFWLAIPVGFFLLCYVLYQMYQNSDSVQERKARDLTHRLYKETKALRPTLPDAEAFATSVYRALPDIPEESLEDALIKAALQIHEGEGFDRAGPIPPPTICNSLEGAQYRDYLAEYSARAVLPDLAERATNAVTASFNAFLRRCPPLPEGEGTGFSIPFEDFIEGLEAPLTEALIFPFFDDDVITAGLFKDLRFRLNENLCELSGLAPLPENFESPDLIMPDKYEGEDLPYAYLKDTPLLNIFRQSHVPFSIPDKARFEHGWILAPQGTGKTQLIQFLVSEDLKRVERDEASIVIMDSQGDLIKEVSRLKEFAKGEALHDKLVLLEPDPDYPLALNIFDMGKERMNGYSNRDKEQLSNNSLDLGVPSVVSSITPPEESRKSESNDEREARELEEAELLEKLRKIEEMSFEQARDQIRQAINKNPELSGLKDHVIIDMTPEGLRIQIVDQFNESMFESGSATITPKIRNLVGMIAKSIEELPNSLSISGHTDSASFSGGTYSNWELSSDRANASRRALLDAGLDPERIERVAGRADTDPMITDDPSNPGNRRISIILLRETPVLPANLK